MFRIVRVILLRHPVRIDVEDCFLFTMKELEAVVIKTTEQKDSRSTVAVQFMVDVVMEVVDAVH